MRVIIAGAGSVGLSIAGELLRHGHEVLLIDKDAAAMKVASLPDADWQLADACEISSLEEADLEHCNVVVAATGDDKANLVLSLLAKTEFGVPHVVGRVNNPRNEWMFDAQWGVDVAVSTPRIMASLVEEAVTVGDVVPVFTFRKSNSEIVELTLPENSPVVGEVISTIDWPSDTVLTAILRDGRALPPEGDGTLEAYDELLFLSDIDRRDELQQLLTAGLSEPSDPATE